MPKKAGTISKLIFLGIMAFAILSAYPAVTDSLSVGEKWTFEHEGAMPWRPPEQKIQGDRVIEVVSVENEGDDKRWIIKEKWGTDDRVSRLYVNNKKLIDKINVGNNNVININPPMPYNYMGLNAGEEKELKFEFQTPDGNTIPIAVKAKRLEDETLEVPAGEFKNCVHIKTEETVSFSAQGQEMKFVTNRDLWYHSKVNGLVKEQFTTKLPFPGQTESVGTSTLKSYSNGN